MILSKLLNGLRIGRELEENWRVEWSWKEAICGVFKTTFKFSNSGFSVALKAKIYYRKRT